MIGAHKKGQRWKDLNSANFSCASVLWLSATNDVHAAFSVTGDTYGFERFVDNPGQASNTPSSRPLTISAPNSALGDSTYISIPSRELLETHRKLALSLGIQNKKCKVKFAVTF
jgi:hypothetical protein